MAELAKFLFQRVSSVFGPEASIEDTVFKLHSVLTSRGLLVLALFTFVKTLSTPMACYGIKAEVIDHTSLVAYCELQDSYGIPNYRENANQSVDYASQQDEQIHRNYFHMLPLFMAIQSIFFYLPHHIWKSVEKGNVANLTCCFRYPIPVFKDELIDAEEQSKRMDLIVGYLVKTWGKHRNKAFVYWVCVALNFAITFAQIGIIDALFVGEFTTKGLDVYRNVLWADHRTRTDRISHIFPRLITCNFRRIVSDGQIKDHTAFCALPFNYINERLLILTLSWFFALSLIGFMAFLFWALTFCISCCQYRYLGNATHFVSTTTIETIMGKYEPSNVGDWFILWLISKNMNSIHYHKLMYKLINYNGKTPDYDDAYRLLPNSKTDQAPSSSHENYTNL